MRSVNATTPAFHRVGRKVACGQNEWACSGRAGGGGRRACEHVSLMTNCAIIIRSIIIVISVLFDLGKEADGSHREILVLVLVT